MYVYHSYTYVNSKGINPMINNIQYTTFKVKVNVHKLFSFQIYYRREKEYPIEFVNQCISKLNSSEEVKYYLEELKKVYDFPTTHIIHEDDILIGIKGRRDRNYVFIRLYRIKALFINMLDSYN